MIGASSVVPVSLDEGMTIAVEEVQLLWGFLFCDWLLRLAATLVHRAVKSFDIQHGKNHRK